MRLIAILWSILAGGCLAMEEAASEWPQVEGTAVVFFYSDPGARRAGVTSRVFDGDVPVGALWNGTCFVYLAREGWHEFSVRRELASMRRVYLEPGKRYYFSVTVETGLLSPQVNLRSETTREGEAAIANVLYLQRRDLHGPLVEPEGTRPKKRPKPAPATSPASAPTSSSSPAP
jgi:hypothetical protein